MERHEIEITLEDGVVQAGRIESVWDGRDDAGRAVATGVYLVRLRGAGGEESRKAILLR